MELALQEEAACVKSLSIANNAIRDLAVCRKLRSLVDLDASQNVISQVSLPSIDPGDMHERAHRAWPRLVSLSLASNALSELDGTLFHHTPALVRLNLSRNALKTLPRAIAELPALASLDISDNALYSLATLHGMRQLRSLNAAGNAIRKLGDVLAALPSLQALDLSRNPLWSFSALRPCASLRTLRASGTAVASVRELRHLAGLRLLCHLELQDTMITRAQGAGMPVDEYRLRTLAVLPQHAERAGRRRGVRGGQGEGDGGPRFGAEGALPRIHRPTLARVPLALLTRTRQSRLEAHARHLPGVPFRNRVPVLSMSEEPPRLLTRIGKKQSGVYVILEALDTNEEHLGLEVKAYVPQSSNAVATLIVTADEYNETHEMLRRHGGLRRTLPAPLPSPGATPARGQGRDAKGSWRTASPTSPAGHHDSHHDSEEAPDAAAAATSGEQPPDVMDVVLGVLSRVQAHFKHGDASATPTLWLAPLPTSTDEPLLVRRSLDYGSVRMVVEVVPAGKVEYEIMAFPERNPNRKLYLLVPVPDLLDLGIANAATRNLPREQRMEIMAELAQRVRVQSKAGVPELALERGPGAVDSVFL